MTDKPAIQDIVAAVCGRFDLQPDELRGPSKLRAIMRPRQIAMFLARELTPLSLPQIGNYFGKDHTTVLHAARRIEVLMDEKPKVAAYVSECRALVVPNYKKNVRAIAAQPLVKVAG